MEKRISFETQTFSKRLNSMLKVDFRRMFTMPLLYIMVGVSFLIPILILVMTTSMSQTMITDHVTGLETPMETFTNVWQIIASTSSESATMSMNLTGMCNINMLYFLIAVLICVFVSDDFRSGYAKNLFTTRSKKSDYIISKSVIGFVGGTMMIIAFFLGAMIGGAIAKLPFDVGSAGVNGIVMCMISKILIVLIFVSIFLTASVFAKQMLWLSILLSLGVGMLFFTMIPIMTPLDANLINVIMCLFGSLIFSFAIGYASYYILKKTSIL